MKYFLFFLLITRILTAEPTRHELEIGDSRLTYYLEFPGSTGSYPLMLVLEGSFVEELGPRSILQLHAKISQIVLGSDIGMVTMDKRGINGKQVDVDLFHRFNTPSQRFSDHMRLIEHFKAHPPQNWNGQWIILGGSEGGPIAIKLANVITPSACVVLVGCGDQTFSDYIWQVIQSIPLENKIGRSLPIDRKDYESQIEMMKAHPDPTCFWFGQSFLYWADALDQTESREFLSLKCPVFVASGSKDIECSSTDSLIAKARKGNQDVTYLRIEGMGHNVLDPQWNVMPELLKWLEMRL